jgi:hypothetical protein
MSAEQADCLSPRLRESRRLAADRSGLLFWLSVLNALEVETPRRRCAACVDARATTGEQLRNLLRPTLDHGPDEGPHHVSQEAVGLDLELERVTVPVPRGPLDHADERLVTCLGGREGAEVVLAEQKIRVLGERLLVERPRIPPAPVLLERRALPAPVDAIPIRPGASRVASVEVPGRVLGGNHGDIGRKVGVQRLGRAIRRRAPLDLDGGDVPECVYPGVRAARDCQAVPGGKHLSEARTELALNGPAVGLRRPAPEPGAVVLESEFEPRRYWTAGAAACSAGVSTGLTIGAGGT